MVFRMLAWFATPLTGMSSSEGVLCSAVAHSG